MTSANLLAWVWAIIRLWLVTIKFENKCFVTKISSKINYSNVCVQKTCTCRCSHALGDLKVVIVDKVWKEIFFFTKISLKNISICLSRKFVFAHVRVMLWEIWRLWLLLENVKRNMWLKFCIFQCINQPSLLALKVTILLISGVQPDLEILSFCWNIVWRKKIVSVKWHNARQDGLKSPKFSAMLLG